LTANQAKEDAVFCIRQYGGGSDESYIEANKAGLRLFASELLFAFLKSEQAIKDKKFIPLNHHTYWSGQDTETCIHYVEPIDSTRTASAQSIKTNQLKNNVIQYLFFAGLLFILACLVTGLITIFKTLVNLVF